MTDKHRVSRAVHFPQSFPNEVFSPAALLNFQAVNRSDPDSTYAMSVVCRCMLPEDRDIHDYGVSIAEKQNERNKSSSGDNSPPENKRFYLAFYDVSYEELADIVLEHYELRIASVPEEGCDAHMEIHFKSLRKQVTKKQRRSDRAAAIDLMAERLIGPVLYPDASSPDEIDSQQQLPKLPLPV